MANGPNPGSMLPPDLKQRMAEQQRGRGGGGIGGGAHENAATARQRDLAMNPNEVAEEKEAAQAAAEEEAKDDLKVCPNPRCAKDLNADWGFCAHCGSDLLRGGPASRLGITFTDADMNDYIFKGYVVKELTILGKHKITVKSSQAVDTDDIDNYMVNGSWAKKPDGSRRDVSEFYVRQMQTCCVTAAGVMKFDGSSIGDSLEKRVTYFMERGSAFVDLVSSRVVLFNQALFQHLKKADAFSGS